MFTVDFFGELSLIGWFGLALWFVIPGLIIATNGDYDKNRWFRDFDERLPRFEFITDMFGQYGEAGTITWLVVRIFIMEVVMIAIGYILILI